MIAALALALAPALAPAPDPFEDGVAAYRAGDYAAAEAAWREVLDEELGEADRGRVLKNLGNAAYRAERPVEAAAWYEAAVAHLPRDRALWADLELARREGGLEPFDRGDWSSAVWRTTHFLTATESALLACALLLALAALLAVEALRGGRRVRLLALGTLLLLLAAASPLVVRALEPQGYDLVSVARGGAPLRSEPRADLSVTGRLDAGARAREVDRLLGWVRVEGADGEAGWVPADALVSLCAGGH